MNGGTFQGPAGICKICNVELQDRLIASQHYNGKQHLTNVARMSKRQENVRNGVFVRRSDISTIPDSEFIALFSQFGFVQEIRRPPTAKNYCVVKFEDSCAAQRALNARRLFLKGKYLPISPERVTGTRHNMKRSTKPNLKQSQPFVDRKKVAALPEPDLVNLNDLPDNIVSFDDAVNDFVKRIEADPSLEQKHQMVCADLEWTFSKELPGVKARLFGSTITGLAFKESDLDIFMECPKEQPGRNFVAKKTDVMFKVGLFRNIIKISHARVPIVKCVHKKSNIACDVTFVSKLGVMNSKLIRFLLSCDPRLRNLFLIIKYWCKVQKLTGPGKLTNYALAMLIVYYLQQLHDRILPPIKYLQDLAVDKELSGNWECSFSDNLDSITPNQNTSTLKELLGGFFEFYSNFDFKKYIVCPLIGKVVDKSLLTTEDLNGGGDATIDSDIIYLLHKLKNLPDEMKFTTNAPFCIQDPFDLSFNLTKYLPENYCKNLTSYFSYTWEKAFDPNVNFDYKEFFKLLFKPPDAIMKNLQFVNHDEFVKCLSMSFLHLPNTTLEYRDTLEYKIKWFKAVKDTIKLVFERVYKFKIEMCHDKNLNVNVKNISDVTEFTSLNFMCFGDVPVHVTRKKVRKLLNFNKSNCLEQEIKISDYIVRHNQEMAAFSTYVKLLCHPNVDHPNITLVMNDIGIKKFNMFKAFTEWIRMMLNEYCRMALQYTVDNETYFYKLANDKKLESNNSTDNKSSTSNLNNVKTRMPRSVSNDNFADHAEHADNKQSSSESMTDVDDVTGIINSYINKTRNGKRRKKNKFPYMLKKHDQPSNDPDPTAQPGVLLLEAIERPINCEIWD